MCVATYLKGSCICVYCFRTMLESGTKWDYNVTIAVELLYNEIQEEKRY